MQKETSNDVHSGNLAISNENIFVFLYFFVNDNEK